MTQDAPAPWTPQGDGPDPRRHAPATLRNRDAIAAVLQEELPDAGLVLEVASGSGEHIVHFAGLFSALDWQPSDQDCGALASIAARCRDAALINVRAPRRLDAAAEDWPVNAADAILCINMVHISPWVATLGLLAASVRLLPIGAPLILYGPYVEDGIPTAATNLTFDRSLKARDAQWGLRDVAAVDKAAAANGLKRTRRIAMPANNLMLVYRRNRL